LVFPLAYFFSLGPDSGESKYLFEKDENYLSVRIKDRFMISLNSKDKLILFLAILAILEAGCAKFSIVGPDVGANNPSKYVALGDSITYGAGSETGGYPSRLERKLKAYFGEAEVVNEGLGGHTTEDGVVRVGGILERENPGYLLILFGANDIIQGQLSLEDTISNLRVIIQTAKNRGTIPIVGTITPFDPWGPRGWTHRLGEIYKRNIKIRELAQEENIELADHFVAFNNDFSLLDSTGLHPNDQGYEVLAQTWFEAIMETIDS
jgi:lysophospholipase L1-like esterase